jgi:hypothetical protein
MYLNTHNISSETTAPKENKIIYPDFIPGGAAATHGFFGMWGSTASFQNSQAGAHVLEVNVTQKGRYGKYLPPK